MIERQNFEQGEIPFDTEYRRCSFRRLQPVSDGQGGWRGHQLFPDNIPRTFYRCHLLNVEVPPGSTTIECNTAIADTRTVGEVDETIIDGVVVSRIQYYDSTVYGYHDHSTLERVLFETPQVNPRVHSEVEI